RDSPSAARRASGALLPRAEAQAGEHWFDEGREYSSMGGAARSFMIADSASRARKPEPRGRLLLHATQAGQLRNGRGKRRATMTSQFGEGLKTGYAPAQWRGYECPFLTNSGLRRVGTPR